MGATRNLGYIENLISYDGNDNIGIGGAVNVLYKVTIGGNMLASGTLNIGAVTNAGVDTDKFLVLDTNGTVRFRTGAELASDIGPTNLAASTLKHVVKLGETVSKGQAVYVSSADGTNMIVSKASNASEATSSKTLGLVETNGVLNDQVNVITEGLLAGLDTSTATIGDPVWLSTNGNLIFGLANKPYAPAHLVFIGVVTRVQQNNGEIFVKVQNGFEIQELHNVQITSTPTDNQVLTYESATSLYKMKTVDGANVTGYALTKTDDTNVTLTLGGSASTSLLRAASLTLGWTGTLAATRGGTGIGTYTLGDILYSSAANTLAKLAGNTTTTKQYLSQTGDGTVSAAPSWSVIAGSDVTGAALTKSDDTNVTLTLGGSASTALLRAASLTLGWTGQLAISRGGTGLSALGTAGQLLRVNSGATALEYWTPTYISAAITSLNGLTGATQTFATGTSGTDFGISSSTTIHTFNLPTASATNRGALSSTDWSTFNGKQDALNGTGFVKISGTTISYDNSTYLTSYTETDTLATVTGRGASTTNTISISASSLQHLILANRFHLIGGTNFHITNNAYYDGSFKYKDSVSPASKIVLNGNGTISYDYAPAGTIDTVVPFTTVWSIGTNGSITANSFIKSGGTSSQILMADGSVITAGTNITISGGTISSTGGSSLNGTGFVRMAGTTVSYITGTSSQFVKADGSLDGTGYEPTVTKGNLTSANTAHLTVTGGTGAIIGSGVNLTILPGAIVNSGLGLTTTGNSGAATFSNATLNIPNYTLAGLGGLPLSGGTMTGQLRIDLQNTINTTTPGTGTGYGLHFGGQATADYATGITFSAGGAAAANANAGIYVQGSGSYGTKMYIATTDSYATGSKTAISIDHTGLVNFVRAVPTVQGNSIWHAGNLTPSNYLPLSGGTMTGNVIASGDTYTTYGPNSTWTSYLRVGGNGRTVSGNTYASVVTTNGNLHLDSGDSRSTYLNYYAGTGGIAFGTGASGVAAWMGPDGDLWKGGADNTGTQYVYNSGTWSISISGNSATVASLTPPQFFNNMGNNHGTYTDFNSVGDFGVRYLQGGTNGPGTGASQYYGFTLGLGNQYPLDGAGSYASQFYWNRTATGGNPYVSVRFKEGNSWGGWSKIYAGYADNADTVDGYHVAVAGTANTIPTRNGSGYLIPENWIQLNGHYGLYSGTNNAHFYPNNNSYGSWKIIGERNGWRGLHFGEGTGITLMMNEGEFGFHRESVGWVARFTSGTGHFNISGSAASASTAGSTPTLSLQGLGNGSVNVNNGSSAVYRNENGNGGNLSYAPVLHLGGSDTMWQIQGDYYNSTDLRWRAGYAGTWYSWRQILHSGNYTSYTIPIGGSWYGSGLPGSRWYGYSVNGGEFVLGNGLPNAGQVGVLVDGCYVAGENNGFWSMDGSNTWGSRRGMYWDGSYLNFTTNTPTARFQAVYADGDITAFSDARVKENIRSIDNALQKVMSSKGVIYDRTDTGEKNNIGFIAQELEEQIPNLVKTDTEGFKSIKYQNMVAVLVEAIKEQQKQIEELKSQIKNK